MPLSNLPKDIKVDESYADIPGVESWYYEEPYGFSIIVKIPPTEKPSVVYAHLHLSWRDILASVKRCRRGLRGKRK